MDTLSGKKCFKKKKQVELYAVCDKSISFIIDIDELKEKAQWLPGWKDL